GGGGRGWGRSFFLRGIFERLDTSPGQEKAIRAALDELRAATHGVRDEMAAAREETARVIRGEALDDDALGGIRARTSAAADTMQSAALTALGKIHEALDERQRNLLADLIDAGPRGFGGFGRAWGGGSGGGRGRGGPYRGSQVA